MTRCDRRGEKHVWIGQRCAKCGLVIFFCDYETGYAGKCGIYAESGTRCKKHRKGLKGDFPPVLITDKQEAWKRG